MSASDAPMRVGIFGGTFNPVHIGHTMLASYMAEFGGFDQVWMMLSPLNPLKAGQSAEIASDADRLAMLRLAVGDSPKLKVSDVELNLPRPSYTIDTLDALAALYPGVRFTPIIGSDNWLHFDRWRRWREILGRGGVAVYPRPGYHVADRDALPPGVDLIEAPQIELSSTFIRQSIASGRDMRFFLPPGVADYIAAHRLYR